MKITKKYLERIIKEEAKKYIGQLSPGAVGAANLGLNKSYSMPAGEDYSPADGYLAQRSSRGVDRVASKINLEFGKLDQRLTAVEKSIAKSELSGEEEKDGTVEIDPSQWDPLAAGDSLSREGLERDSDVKAIKSYRYLKGIIEEETRSFLKEEASLAPGSYPIDGAGQSGIPVVGGGGTGAKERSKKDPESETESGPEEHGRAPLALYIQYWCSLEALAISARTGDHRYLAKTTSGKPILETAMKKIQSAAIREGYTLEEMMRVYKSMKPKFDKASETYQFTEKELWKITHDLDERLPEDERDRDAETEFAGRYNNIEAYMNSGMPRQETRPNQYGMPLTVLANIVRSAEKALKSVGLSKYAEPGPDWPYLFRPSFLGARVFKLIKNPASVVRAVRKN
jgi:hypothetical protein